MTPTPNNKKTLAEMFEESSISEYTNEYSYRHKVPNYEKIIDWLTTAEADIEKRVREETLKEVEEATEVVGYNNAITAILTFINSKRQ